MDGKIWATDSIYHNYGYFAIQFEHLVLSMKRCIYTLFKNQGLNENKYLRIVLHDQTALPILSKLRSLLAEHFKDEPNKLKVLEKLFTHTTKIIEKRNEIIHGNFFVNATPDGDLLKDKIVKTGLKTHEEKIDLNKFRNYIQIVIRARDMFKYLDYEMQSEVDNFDDFINEVNIESLKIDLN